MNLGAFVYLTRLMQHEIPPSGGSRVSSLFASSNFFTDGGCKQDARDVMRCKGASTLKWGRAALWAEEWRELLAFRLLLTVCVCLCWARVSLLGLFPSLCLSVSCVLSNKPCTAIKNPRQAAGLGTYNTHIHSLTLLVHSPYRLHYIGWMAGWPSCHPTCLPTY